MKFPMKRSKKCKPKAAEEGKQLGQKQTLEK